MRSRPPRSALRSRRRGDRHRLPLVADRRDQREAQHRCCRRCDRRRGHRQVPDQNLAESLQRIPGISIQRDARRRPRDHRARPRRAVHPRARERHGDGRHLAPDGASGQSRPRLRLQRLRLRAVQLASSCTRPRRPRSTRARSARWWISTPAIRWRRKTASPSSARRRPAYNDLQRQLGARARRPAVVEIAERRLRRLASPPPTPRPTICELGQQLASRWACRRASIPSNGTPCFTPSPIRAAAVMPERRSASIRPPSPSPAHFPRYGERRRMIASAWASPAACNGQPTDATKDLDRRPLFHASRETREEKWLRGAAPLQRALDRRRQCRCSTATTTLIDGTFDDAWVRTEHYLRKSDTEFYQIGGSWDQDVDRQLPLHGAGRLLQVGRRASRSRRPSSSTTAIACRAINTTTPTSRSPLLSFGTSVDRSGQFPARRDPRSPLEHDQQVPHRPTAHRMGCDGGLSGEGGRRLSPLRFDVRGRTARRRGVRDEHDAPGPTSVLKAPSPARPPRSSAPSAVYGFPAARRWTELVNAAAMPASRTAPPPPG